MVEKGLGGCGDGGRSGEVVLCVLATGRVDMNEGREG